MSFELVKNKMNGTFKFLLTERGKDIQNVLSDISQSVLMNLILLKKKPKFS